jgi:hypothetical protein
MASRQIQWLKDDHNLQGLEKVLRHPSDPTLRAEAAQALGELDDLEAVEMLIRSSLEDPDLGVQKAARGALDNLIGSEAQQAINAYRSTPAADPWLLTDLGQASEETGADEEWEEISGEELVDYLESGEEGEEGGEEETDELEDVPEGDLGDEDSLRGLTTVMQTHKDPAVRLRALQLLGRSRNIHAVWYLAQTALYNEDSELKASAQAMLEERFGDRTAAILEGYKDGDLERDLELEEDEDDEGEEYEEEVEQPESPFQRSPSLQDVRQPQVIQEDSMHWRLVFVAVLAVLGVVAIILLLSLRG